MLSAIHSFLCVQQHRQIGYRGGWKLTRSGTHKVATKNSIRNIAIKAVMGSIVNGIYKIRIVWVQNFSGHCKACSKWIAIYVPD